MCSVCTATARANRGCSSQCFNPQWKHRGLRPETGLHCAPLRIRGYSTFDGRHEQPVNLYRAARAGQGQTQKWHKESGQFSKIKTPCANFQS